MRASQHSVDLQVKYECVLPHDKNGNRLPSYMVAVGCELNGSPDDIKAALADLRNFATPAPIPKIEGWLAELSVISAKRQDDGFTEGLRLSAYASRLSQYPADVARYCILEKTWKFWPTWSEMKEICDAKAGPRMHMIAALEHQAAPEMERDPPVTKEQAAKIMAEYGIPTLRPKPFQSERQTQAFINAAKGAAGE